MRQSSSQRPRAARRLSEAQQHARSASTLAEGTAAEVPCGPCLGDGTFLRWTGLCHDRVAGPVRWENLVVTVRDGRLSGGGRDHIGTFDLDGTVDDGACNFALMYRTGPQSLHSYVCRATLAGGDAGGDSSDAAPGRRAATPRRKRRGALRRVETATWTIAGTMNAKFGSAPFEMRARSVLCDACGGRGSQTVSTDAAPVRHAATAPVAPSGDSAVNYNRTTQGAAPRRVSHVTDREPLPEYSASPQSVHVADANDALSPYAAGVGVDVSVPLDDAPATVYSQSHAGTDATFPVHSPAAVASAPSPAPTPSETRQPRPGTSTAMADLEAVSESLSALRAKLSRA